MSRSGIVNVRMVITEEKILSNIDKVLKLINPNSKKQIVQLEEDSYFKDLIESIKTYLIEYPKKKNFPISVYRATYELVEFATAQFEENTKKIEELIKQREENIILSGQLKEAIKAVDDKQEGWEEKVYKLKGTNSEDIVDALKTVTKCNNKLENQNYKDSMKLLKARVNNLESNLHIEIDIERLEDCAKALSYIGIEVAEALKLIPTPEEQIEKIALENAKEEEKVQTKENVNIAEEKGIEEIIENVIIQEDAKEHEEYVKETTFEAKPSLWQKIKTSKIFRAATYVFRIKVKIELPSNSLPEGNGQNI